MLKRDDQAVLTRAPFHNLLRVVELAAAGRVSKRTLTLLLKLAEAEPYDRSVDGWIALIEAFESVEALAEPTGAYRRRYDPEPARRVVRPPPLPRGPRRRCSGVQRKIEPDEIPDTPKTQSG